MSARQTAKMEIFVGGALILFGTAIFSAAGNLPPPNFEPLGSAALPRILAVIMAALCLIMMLRGVRSLREPVAPSGDVPANDTEERGLPPQRPYLSVAVFLSTVCFVAVMDLKLLSFAPAGVAYMSFILFLMNDMNMKRIPVFVAFSAVLVLSSYWVFTRFFFIDLP